jgi:hypothetical protein
MTAARATRALIPESQAFALCQVAETLARPGSTGENGRVVGGKHLGDVIEARGTGPR